MDKNFTYINKIVVERPHDPVLGFIQSTRRMTRPKSTTLLFYHPLYKLQDTSLLKPKKKLQKQEKTLFHSVLVEIIMMWCLGVWKDWSCSRNSRTDTNSSKGPSNPASCGSTAQLSHWPEAFVVEILTKQGKEYSPFEFY